jgi:hypothetical protein
MMYVQKVYHILRGQQINHSFSNHDDNHYMFTSQWHPILINDEDGRDKCALVWCSTLCIKWTDVQKKFILKFKLGEDFNSSYVSVSVTFCRPIDIISRLWRRWLVPILHRVAKKKLE